MSTATLMICGLLLGTEPSEGSKANVTVRLEPRQELVWTGTFTEQTLRSGVRSQRLFDFEARLLALNSDPTGTEAALLTTFRLQSVNGKEAPPSSPICRLDLIHVAPSGQVKQLNPEPWLERRGREFRPKPTLPIDELPTEEIGMFLEFPVNGLAEGRVWDRTEPTRPFQEWKVTGTEQPRGACCYRVVSDQESDDWGRGSSREASFRLTESLLICRGTGLACKVERVVETRDPNSPEVTFRTELKYEQTQRSRLTGESFRERTEEIWEVVRTQAVLDQLTPRVGRETKPFEGVLNHLVAYESNNRDREELPYREALLRLKERTEIARRGQLPTDLKQTRFRDLVRTGIRVNDAAPDVLVQQIDAPDAVRLKRLRSKPVVLMYVRPESLDFLLMLRAAWQLQERFGTEVAVLPLLVGDAEKLVARKRELNFKVPLYDGNAAVQRHLVARFPTVCVLDRDGVVRSVEVSWGGDTAGRIQAEVERWLK